MFWGSCSFLSMIHIEINQLQTIFGIPMKQLTIEFPSCSFFTCMDNSAVPDFEYKDFKSPKKSLKKNIIPGVTSLTTYKSSPDPFVYPSLAKPSQKRFPPETRPIFQNQTYSHKEQKIAIIQKCPTETVANFKKKQKSIRSLLTEQGHSQKPQNDKLRNMDHPIRFSYQDRGPILKKMAPGLEQNSRVLHAQPPNQIPIKEPKTSSQISNKYLDFHKNDALISTQIILQPHHRQDSKKKFLDPQTQQKFFKRPTIESKFITQQEIGMTKNGGLLPQTQQSNRQRLAISFLGEESENSVVYETHREFGNTKLQTLF